MERDRARAEIAAAVFAGDPRVEVLTGDWPPVHEGQPDEARMYWLNHPQLRAAEVKVTPAAASVVATFVG